MKLPEYLEIFEREILASLEAQAPPGLEESQVLLEGGKYLASAPGAKRARPRLVYNFGLALGALDFDALVDIAISAEFIHGASLLHDDVVDHGTMRRGRPTVNARWGNHVAVLGGDIMLCISIQRLADLPRVITREAVETVAVMSRAAILEVESRGNIDLSLDQWRAIAHGKTGSLFGFCGGAPAHLMGNTDAVGRFRTCGEHLGIAFQMADDLKDLASSTSGKDRFLDIRNRNPSYPVLTAAARSANLKHELRTAWAQPSISAEEATRLGLRVLDTGAASVTRDAILEHVSLAFDALGPYRDRTGGVEVAAWASDLASSYLAETVVA